jgi:uncharacterized protein (TIGR02145 family)
MKEECSTHWYSPNTGATNSSGFTALPGGDRGSYDGTFGYLGSLDFWWSATEYGASYAWYCDLLFDSPGAYLDGSYEADGFSVRCIKD